MHSTSPSTRSRSGLAAPLSSACAILPKTQRSPSSSIATMRIGRSSAGVCFADARRSSLREVSTMMPRHYFGPATRSSSRCRSRTIRSSPFASSARSAGGTCPRWSRHPVLYLLVGPLLQFAFDQDSHILEEGNLRIAQLTGPDVQHAQGANAALTYKQRTSCVEANPRTSADVWVVGKSGIFKCIWDHKQLACRHGARTERGVTGG